MLSQKPHYTRIHNSQHIQVRLVGKHSLCILEVHHRGPRAQDGAHGAALLEEVIDAAQPREVVELQRGHGERSHNAADFITWLVQVVLILSNLQPLELTRLFSGEELRHLHGSSDHQRLYACINRVDDVFPWVLDLRELKHQLPPHCVLEQRPVVAEAAIEHGKATEVATPTALRDIRNGTASAAGLNELVVAVELADHHVLQTELRDDSDADEEAPRAELVGIFRNHFQSGRPQVLRVHLVQVLVLVLRRHVVGLHDKRCGDACT
mmetsp:Transcript_8989/g.15227  ORF Transcript_8989/g.15227 Transcript_8989/m.15227 type:complete len:266 (+) Transcript_8989:198-995(+)